MQKFSIKEAIKFGWKKTKSNFGFLGLVLLIFLAISFLSSFVEKTIESSFIALFWSLVGLNLLYT